jgi:hypothetical protein
MTNERLMRIYKDHTIFLDYYRDAATGYLRPLASIRWETSNGYYGQHSLVSSKSCSTPISVLAVALKRQSCGSIDESLSRRIEYLLKNYIRCLQSSSLLRHRLKTSIGLMLQRFEDFDAGTTVREKC